MTSSLVTTSPALSLRCGPWKSQPQPYSWLSWGFPPSMHQTHCSAVARAGKVIAAPSVCGAGSGLGAVPFLPHVAPLSRSSLSLPSLAHSLRSQVTSSRKPYLCASLCHRPHHTTMRSFAPVTSEPVFEPLSGKDPLQCVA